MRRKFSGLFLAAAAAVSGGCVGVFSESVSAGHPAKGALIGGIEVPAEGVGYSVPAGWRPRGTRYTTERVMRWLTGAFLRASERHPGTIAALGDLSSRGGGEVGRHKSHENGRDVDIFLLAADSEGLPYRLDAAMLRFGSDGRAIAWSPPDARVRISDPLPPVRFDARRTWGIVRALLEDRRVGVQRIFVNDAIARLLVDEAVASGEPESLVARASGLFHQPRRADPHDDHMHVRVACDPEDHSVGCTDRAPPPEARRGTKRRRRFAAALAPRAPLGSFRKL